MTRPTRIFGGRRLNGISTLIVSDRHFRDRNEKAGLPPSRARRSSRKIPTCCACESARPNASRVEARLEQLLLKSGATRLGCSPVSKSCRCRGEPLKCEATQLGRTRKAEPCESRTRRTDCLRYVQFPAACSELVAAEVTRNGRSPGMLPKAEGPDYRKAQPFRRAPRRSPA
jgi:hypothetical protein